MFMLRRRPPLVIGPELDDDPLRRTIKASLKELRSSQQLPHAGGGVTRRAWIPVAELLRATDRNWDLRVHRISVLARALPLGVTLRWIKDCPRDPDALVVQACARVSRITGTPWPDAREEYSDCKRAAEAAPEDPTPWLAMLRLMDVCGSPVRRTVPVWNEAVARAPWNRTVFHQMLHHLSPRRHGTLMGMIEFAERSAHQAPHGSPVALLPLAARVELVAHRMSQDSAAAFAADRHWYEPGATREADTALAKWFCVEVQPHAEALADLNLLAFALTRLKRTDDAAPVFRRIGRDMTHHPWNLLPKPVAAFQYWRDRSCA
ncbi:hypothetical protein AB0M11_35760 [Streptomyces sp. NPDC051987]|uniref:hypothetical protein n=1 Tax=Streptomyces sp. NPDC051987 TaxID=3155808 RepID=UPI00343DAC28